MKKPSLQSALTTFAALALLAILTLTEPVRIVTVIFLAGFALKTYIGHLRDRQDAADHPHLDREDD